MTIGPLVFDPNVAAIDTEFDPLAPGSTTVTVETPPGFDPPNNRRQITATVSDSSP